ncbi:MAG TPA: CrcB family protein [Solirubrobacteraceae bacterium]|nr:CrcB family protein [Solirubrobacteraceae bacterium]
MDIDTPSPNDTPQPRAPIEDVGELPESFRAAHPRISLLELVMVGAGGAVGALGRVGCEQAWPTAVGSWPWATFAVNILGALLLGSLMSGLRHGPVSIPAYRLLGTGFCGALTTFSTMQFELLGMLDRARYDLAIGYVGASVVGGYAAVSIAAKLITRAAVGIAAEAEAWR